MLPNELIQKKFVMACHLVSATLLRCKAHAFASAALCGVLLAGMPAKAEGEFLTFKDPPLQHTGPMADQAISTSLSGLKALLDTPQLWETRLDGRRKFDAPSGPAAQGLFTPRYAGGEVALLGDGADATSNTGGVGVSLFAKPLTISGVSPVALDTGDITAGDQAYNLGLNLGISRFQVGAAFSRFSANAYDFGATGLDVDVRYLGDSWQTNLALSGVSASQNTATSLGRGLGLIHDQSFAVEWGASYLLTPRLSLGGSLRFSGFKDGDIFGDSSTTTTDSAVFLGTNLEF